MTTSSSTKSGAEKSTYQVCRKLETLASTLEIEIADSYPLSTLEIGMLRYAVRQYFAIDANISIAFERHCYFRKSNELQV